MSEAPRRIYWTPDEQLAGIGKHDDDDIEYIRADIVEEMREALELMVSYGNVFAYKAWQENPHEKAKAALKRLEEE